VPVEHRTQYLRVADAIRRKQPARLFEKQRLRFRVEQGERGAVCVDERVSLAQLVDHVRMVVDVGIQIRHATCLERVDPRLDAGPVLYENRYGRVAKHRVGFDARFRRGFPRRA